LAPGNARRPPGVYPAAHAALNGQVERSHRVDAPAFYQLLDQDTDDIQLFNSKLREWEDYYQLPPAVRRAGRTNAVRAADGKDES